MRLSGIKSSELSVSPRRPSEAGPTDPARPPSAGVPDGSFTGLGVQPVRARDAEARHALATDGAVVLPGLALVPGSLAVAAAEVAGEDLRRLYPVRHRGADGDGVLDLHADAFHVVHDVHGDLRAERDPDEDLLLMLLTRAPSRGGGSVVVDAYALLDRFEEVLPAVHAVLSEAELDLLGAWRDLPGVPTATRASYLVEHTRRGRRSVRMGSGLRPLLRSPDHAAEAAALDVLRAAAAAAAAHAPRVVLEPGDVLVLDNYRCWHGRDAFDGPRQLFVQTARTRHAF